jgi:hypothetical protein
VADNLNTPHGVIASKDVGGAQYQREIIYALDGSGAQVEVRGTTTLGVLVEVSKVRRVSLTASSPTFATVGTSSSVVKSANASRTGLTLTNTSANWIYLAFGVAAEVGKGIPLAGNGGSYSMGEYDFTTQEVRAIASAASSNLAIQEYV